MALTDDQLNAYFNEQEPAGEEQQQAAPESGAKPGTDEERTINRYGGDINKLARGYIDLQSHSDKTIAEMRKSPAPNQNTQVQENPEPRYDFGDSELTQAFEKSQGDPYRLVDPKSQEHKEFVNAIGKTADRIATQRVAEYEQNRALQEQKALLLKKYPDAEKNLDQFVTDMQNPQMQLTDLYRIWAIDNNLLPQEQMLVEDNNTPAPVINKPRLNPTLEQAQRNISRAPSAANIPGSGEQEDALSQDESNLQDQFGDMY